MTDQEAEYIINPDTTMVAYAKEIGNCGVFDPSDIWKAAVDEACVIAASALRERMEREGVTDINVVNRWISVEDGLPESTNDVIVCGHNCFGQVSVFTAFRAVDEIDCRINWFSMELGYVRQPHNVVYNWTITHWQPLPKPPGEERDSSLRSE